MWYTGLLHRADDCVSGCSSTLLFCLLLLVTLSGSGRAGGGGIVIVTDADSAAHHNFEQSFNAQWGSADTPPARTVHLSADEPPEVRLPDDATLVITVGSVAARAVAAQNPDRPVLNTVVPESVYRSIAGSRPACYRHTAIFIDQPVRRQSALAGLLFPDRTDYGVLLGPVSSRRRPEIDALEPGAGRNVTVKVVSRDDSTMAAGRELLAGTDLLLAVNDPLVMSRENAKWLLYVAYQRRLPVIGFSNAYVRAGAAAAVYSDIGQMAGQAVDLVRQWQHDGAGCLPGPRYTRDFNVAINRAVCRSLGCDIRDEDDLARIIGKDGDP